MNSIRLISQGRPFFGNGETNNQLTNLSNRLGKLALKTKVVALLFFMSGNFSVNATHVVGGGITYQQIEATTYLITVKLYKDCSPGTADLPNNVVLEVRRGDGTPSAANSFNLPNITADTLTPAVPACTFDPGICVQEAIYQKVVTLPPGLGGYHLYFTICCRNGTVQNIVNPLGTRETFYAYIPDNNIYIYNSSPIFNTIPPVYVCAGEDLNLDFSASEIDGDSLVYSFYTPFDGNNGTGITYGAGVPPNNITISPVIWQPGFGATDPLDGVAGLLPGLTISNNGLINGIPTAPGQYVVGVMVDEYRNGILIGRITRDFQFNVLNCPPPATAGIDVLDNCNGLNIDFTNTSGLGTTTYWWDFGTLNPIDTSTQFEPSFSYLLEGVYTVTLIVEKGTACADTVTYDVSVMNPVQFNVDIDSISCFGLIDGQALASATDPQYVYNWSTTQTGNLINNLAVGNYWAEATNTIGCVDTQFFFITEPNVLNVQINDTEPLCNGDLNGSLDVVVSGGTIPYTYFWPFSGSTTNPLSNIVAGNYSVEITDANGCFVTSSIVLNEPNVLTANAQVLGNIICFGDSTGIATAQGTGGTAPYTYFWTETSQTTQITSNLWAGTYNVTVTDNNGCQATSFVDIIEYADVTAQIIFDPNFCPGDTVDFYVATNGLNNQYDYMWYVDHVLEGTDNTFSFVIDDTVTVAIVMVNTGNCPSVVDITVVGPIMIPLGNITVLGTPDTICFGVSTVIQGVILDTSNVTSIFWNDLFLNGLGPHSVSPSVSTEYIITIENVCGEQQSDTIMLNLFMPPNATLLAEGTSGCDKVEVNFDFAFDPYEYNYVGACWSIFNQIYDEESPTIVYNYSVDVPATLYLSFNNGCTFAYDDIVGVEVFESPEANFYFNPNPAIQNEVTEFIDISHGNPKEWEWYMDGQLIGDEERPSYIFDETGEFTVTEIIIDENGCSDTITNTVEVIGIYTVYVPNAFTPDGNGLNNYFKPIMTDVVADNYEFLIFNRWGEIVFKANNLDAEWDGRYLGDTVQDGVYIWKIFVTDNVGLRHELLGNITLLR